MTTKSEKTGSNTTTVTTNTKCKCTAESKFTEEPQSKEISSDNGQAYFNVDNSPFAIVKYKGTYRIILGKDIISDQKFPNAKAAKNFIKREKWILTWAMCIWVMTHAEELKAKAALIQKKDEQ